MSQMRAGALPTATEQLALVAALRERAQDACASRLGMPAALFEHEGEVLPDELRPRDATLAGRVREQPIDVRPCSTCDRVSSARSSKGASAGAMCRAANWSTSRDSPHKTQDEGSFGWSVTARCQKRSAAVLWSLRASQRYRQTAVNWRWSSVPPTARTSGSTTFARGRNRGG